MNHTPGPWAIHDKDPRDVREVNGLRFVASCRDSQAYRSHDEACANARLIAAAPDMVAALMAVCAMHATPGDHYRDHIGAMDKARAALKAALS